MFKNRHSPSYHMMFSIYWYVVVLVIFSLFALGIVYLIDIYDKHAPYEDEDDLEDDVIGGGKEVEEPPHMVFLHSGYSALKTGDVDRGVDQLAKAVVVAQDDGKLLKAVEKEIPPWAFTMVLKQIDTVRALVAWNHKHLF